MIPDLVRAAERGDTEAVRRLLAQGAAIDAIDDQGRTAVMAATHGNHAGTVKALIDAGADLDIRDALKDNPFLYAGAEGLLEIVRLCIAAGASPTLTNRFGGSPLIPASERGHVEVVQELLLHSEIDVDAVNDPGWTALLEAVILSAESPRQRRVVELLIEHGANVNIADMDGVTPLAHAQRRGLKEIAEMLAVAGGR